MTVRAVIELFRKELKGMYSPEEIENFIFFSMNEFLGYTRRHLQLKAEQDLDPAETTRFQVIVAELRDRRPIQYILGCTEFYGLKIRVNEHVLIPRPETEELVELVLQRAKKKIPHAMPPSVIDLCTGSGCIAIALKKHMPAADISALDISDEALLVAKGNAILNHTLIHFIQGDILSTIPSVKTGSKGFDIIISNPPYVPKTDRPDMDSNVVRYEPHLALFVPGKDPLLFYRSIASFSRSHLNPGGALYFEIHQKFGTPVKTLLEQEGFSHVEIIKDMSGHDRFVSARQS